MKKLFFLAALLPLMFSCSQEESMENTPSTLNQDVINKVTVTVSPLNERSETRTALTQDAAPQFVWTESDNIGIFSDKGNQMGFSMASGAGSTTAEFDGGGWGLKTSSTYTAYYPLIHDFDLDKTAIPMDYTGQKQIGNGTTAHLGAYDYLSAPATNPENGSVNFAFGHLSTLLHFKFTVPESADLTSIILRTNGVLTEKAILNLITNQVTATATSTMQSLLLENVSVSTNGVLDAFMMIAPTNLSGKTLEATVTSAAGDAYVINLPAHNFVGGDVWNYTCTLAKETGENTYLGHEYVDLGITDENGNKVLWATTNVGANNPWECGGYYAWGETKAYGEEDSSNLHNYSYNNQSDYTKRRNDWNTYKYATGSSQFTLSKYSYEDGQIKGSWYSSDYEGNYIYTGINGIKNQTKLESQDDAATVNWGLGWRTPTILEIDKLFKNCCWKWVSKYGGHEVSGFLVFVAKCTKDKGYHGITPTESYSVNEDPHIFIPAVGCKREGAIDNNGTSGLYWTSELHSLYSYMAAILSFWSGGGSVGNGGNYSRYFGMQIRPVYTH